MFYNNPNEGMEMAHHVLVSFNKLVHAKLSPSHVNVHVKSLMLTECYLVDNKGLGYWLLLLVSFNLVQFLEI